MLTSRTLECALKMYYFFLLIKIKIVHFYLFFFQNSLWEYLNVREHLKVFGRLKGLCDKDLEETVNYYEA